MSAFGPKYQRKIWQISALEFEKGSNHKIKALYNIFNTLNSPCKLCHYKKVPLFCCRDHFLYSRAEICQIFCWFFGKLQISERHSEINWTLIHVEAYSSGALKYAMNCMHMCLWKPFRKILPMAKLNIFSRSLTDFNLIFFSLSICSRFFILSHPSFSWRQNRGWGIRSR